MKLVSSLTTPFGRKIRILLEEKHLPYTLVEDIPWNADSKTPDFNPLGKVPVLVLDGDDGKPGETLFDSRVIAEYLDLRGTPHHIPVEAGARIRVKRWEALADGICDAAASIFIERKRPPAQQSEDWINRQRGKIDAALQEAERQLHGEWCEGPHFTLADAALASALGYLKLRYATEIPLAPYPKLATWFARVEKRPSVAATVAPG